MLKKDDLQTFKYSIDPQRPPPTYDDVFLPEDNISVQNNRQTPTTIFTDLTRNRNLDSDGNHTNEKYPIKAPIIVLEERRIKISAGRPRSYVVDYRLF